MLTPRFPLSPLQLRVDGLHGLLPTLLSPRAENARATLTLALAGLGLIDAVDSFGVPWGSLIASLPLGLFAFRFVFATKRFQNKRWAGWSSAASHWVSRIACSYDVIHAMLRVWALAQLS